jgi:HAE1 family hydrophobic/amphiphilic exporter-1
MKLAETCVKYPVFTVMLIAFLVTLGLFSYRGLAVDLFPKADPATVNVEVRLPGATPEEVVTGVVLPLEDAISSVSGIDEINVWSFEGFADITCTFVLERDIEGAAQDIREKVAGAIDRLPRDTLPPIVTKLDPQSDPIMTLLVSGPMSRRELTEIADKQIRRAIQTVDGVGSVELNGGQGRQIRVLLDAQKLTAHNFTVLDVRAALQRENIEAPGGRMITGPQELGLRTLGRVTSAEQFGEIVIGMRGGAPVRVRDVAQVEDGAQELRTWSALFRKGVSGQDVVSIQVLRQSGVNTVRVADDVRSKLDDLRAQMPPGVQLQVIHDISDFIKASVHSLIEHLIFGSILASLVVWLFIRNWRAVLIAAVAIPASIISTFTLMRGMDFSLNNITLLALTLAVGIVIDDAIIVLENIFRFMEEKGRDRVLAAVEATRNRSCRDGHDSLPGDYFSAHRIHDRLCEEICEFLRMDDGDGHSRFAFGGLHAYADDELALSEIGRKRKEDACRRISPQIGTVLYADVALVTRASAHHYFDLRGDISFDIWFLSPRGTGLDSCR